MEYLYLFYFIQLLLESVGDLVFVLNLLSMTHPFTSFSLMQHMMSNTKTHNTRGHIPLLTLTPSLHCV